MLRSPYLSSFIVIVATGSYAVASPYELLTGVNPQQYPGNGTVVFPNPGPGPGFPSIFFDGDRLAGTADAGPPITWQGVGSPIRQPNDVGAMSFIFRRGTVPFGGPVVYPFMGIESLGGPLIDMDGDNSNGTRSLIPVLNQTPVNVPNSFSHIDLTINLQGGTITVNDFEATGTNEGGPGTNPGVGLTVNSIAGTTPTGGKTGAINAFDNRTGTLTAFAGTDSSLTGVYRISNLQFEFWNDSADPGSSSPDQLGTIQQFVVARGWLVYRDPTTGSFPTLAGHGLGATLWGNSATSVDAAAVGQQFNTAVTLQGPTATIAAGAGGDIYTNQVSGVSTSDIGAYLDTVVAPRIACNVPAFVYIESAGFGINNSFDPVFTDTVAYDLVLIAQEHVQPGDINGDGMVDATDGALFVNILLNPSAYPADQRARADFNSDCSVDGNDIAAFIGSSL